MKQMVDAYHQIGGNVISVLEVPRNAVSSYGVIAPGAGNGVVTEVLGLVEKPKVEDAPSNLIVSGRYILQPEVMRILEGQEKGAGGEIQLTDAMAQMIGQPQAQGYEPAQAPDPVMQRMRHLEETLTSFVQQQQQGTQAQTVTEIESFASDPAHPYFNDVRQDMGVLIQAGRAKDMQQAYDMAVWAHPEIRQTLIDGQIQQKSAQQSHAAQQAQAAAVSISGSPAGAKIASDVPDLTLDEVLKRAQQQHRSA
jgi:hypothetical protein